jgi:Na+-translocating ferredoxin:NAD+ oxidoreductase RnfE subunit
MPEKEIDVEQLGNWRPKVLIIGAVAGALVGMAGAYLFIKQAESRGDRPGISTGEGMRLGLMLMGVLREVAALGEGGKK